ncbi:hypothetical protein SAMN02745885_00810 [Carboxydocella sporoproducens DSM 16521]|uniref:40-residue YVTN family beta-propeller repeat-containing protein n=2 Tax=Carboxydocella TaxID=178898 RepID=A0A1T4N625_9FIRM|nr:MULTISPECIES: hypothetical protein [Carboxydocella]AVX20919.1 hypothetical protein CFE_1748 [Carboxydocella thermautotrophica]AVX31334.1 hypothetical protein CTH_1762 [Carboxydocella thermautotrophica]SJZ74662.1 hypothetical protein SAMN02745885_00810 [Carboxydocella sporoproducens DSM 16521]
MKKMVKAAAGLTLLALALSSIFLLMPGDAAVNLNSSALLSPIPMQAVPEAMTLQVDGTYAYFIDGGGDLARIKLSDSSVEKLVTKANVGEIVEVALDGNYLVFTTIYNGLSKIFCLDLTTKTITDLVPSRLTTKKAFPDVAGGKAVWSEWTETVGTDGRISYSRAIIYMKTLPNGAETTIDSSAAYLARARITTTHVAYETLNGGTNFIKLHNISNSTKTDVSGAKRLHDISPNYVLYSSSGYDLQLYAISGGAKYPVIKNSYPGGAAPTAFAIGKAELVTNQLVVWSASSGKIYGSDIRTVTAPTGPTQLVDCGHPWPAFALSKVGTNPHNIVYCQNSGTAGVYKSSVNVQ